MSDDPPKSGAVPKGRLRRLGKLASMSARAGRSMLKARIKGDDEAAKDAARKVLESLGELKGVALKAGQLAAISAGKLPSELRTIIGELFSRAPSVPFEDVRAVLEEELGGNLAQRFVEIEEEPFAAASLGQVHRAVLPTGETVAVKVQYPGVESALADDLKNLASAVSAMGLGMNVFSSKSYAAEIKAELTRELDYVGEAERLRRFSEFLAPWPDLVVPRVYDSHSTRRVLTMEMLSGVTLEAFTEEGDYEPEQGFVVGEQLTRTMYGPFIMYQVMHADPHPGNFIVLDGDRLGVLDFGNVKRFPGHFAQGFADVLSCTVNDQPIDLLATLRGAGFVVSLKEDRAQSLIEAITEVAGRPLRAPHDFSKCTMVDDLRALVLSRAGEFARVRPPPEGIWLFRALTGFAHNLRTLGSAGDFRPTVRDILDRRDAMASPPA